MWLILYSFPVFCDATIHIVPQEVYLTLIRQPQLVIVVTVIARHLQGGSALLFKDY